ncbi:flagellar basal body-associated FliL family protein [Helicobacter aurati]|nr:hypothetical protein [Helicobacter aurati]
MAEEEKPATEPKKGKATLFIIIGAIVAVLLLGGIIAWLVFGGGDEDGHDSHAADIPAPTGQSLTPEQQALLQNEAYRNPVAIQPLEKTILVNLKPLD